MSPAAPSRPTFSAVRCTDLADQDRRVAALTDGAPFLALAPMRPKSLSRAFEPWIFTLAEDGRVIGVGAGFLREARLGRSLVLVLSTPLPAADEFWSGVARFRSEERAAGLIVESAGDQHPAIPRLPGERERLVSTTYLIDLTRHDGRASLTTNHRRNVQRAVRAGAEVRRRTDTGAAAAHVALVRSSLSRIAARGDEVEGSPTAAAVRAYLQSSHAVIFQAVVEGEVHSSDLVVRLGDASYYLSGGTSAEGNKLGTAHFLMARIMERLKAEGARTLNLGYPNGPGLARFKEGFDARPIPVERVEARTAGGFVDALRGLAARVRR
jgi:hypothetical protein